MWGYAWLCAQSLVLVLVWSLHVYQTAKEASYGDDAIQYFSPVRSLSRSPFSLRVYDANFRRLRMVMAVVLLPLLLNIFRLANSNATHLFQFVIHTLRKHKPKIYKVYI